MASCIFTAVCKSWVVSWGPPVCLLRSSRDRSWLPVSPGTSQRLHVNCSGPQVCYVPRAWVLPAQQSTYQCQYQGLQFLLEGCMYLHSSSE